MVTLQVGVKAFLKNKDGRYLLLHRSAEKYKGTKGSWDIVGGRIEPGTKLMENLKREVKEETGLAISSEPRLIHAQDIIPNPEKHVVRLTYVADADGTPVLDTAENVEYEWLTASEMKAHDDLDIYVKEILERGILGA
ncbi:MAG: NUDIX domain-containing protein [Patescibacteria group bacterium]|nr:NUDIX domain-containing protein [Patescibacteria group bacterium]